MQHQNGLLAKFSKMRILLLTENPILANRPGVRTAARELEEHQNGLKLSKVLGHKQNMMAELTHEQALDSWHSLAGPSSPAAEPR